MLPTAKTEQLHWLSVTETVSTFPTLFPTSFLSDTKSVFLKNLKTTLFCAGSLSTFFSVHTARRDLKTVKSNDLILSI